MFKEPAFNFNDLCYCFVCMPVCVLSIFISSVLYEFFSFTNFGFVCSSKEVSENEGLLGMGATLKLPLVSTFIG